jgi:hypothetical protein
MAPAAQPHPESWPCLLAARPHADARNTDRPVNLSASTHNPPGDRHIAVARMANR